MQTDLEPKTSCAEAAVRGYLAIGPDDTDQDVREAREVIEAHVHRYLAHAPVVWYVDQLSQPIWKCPFLNRPEAANRHGSRVPSIPRQCRNMRLVPVTRDSAPNRDRRQRRELPEMLACPTILAPEAVAHVIPEQAVKIIRLRCFGVSQHNSRSQHSRRGSSRDTQSGRGSRTARPSGRT